MKMPDFYYGVTAEEEIKGLNNELLRVEKINAELLEACEEALTYFGCVTTPEDRGKEEFSAIFWQIDNLTNAINKAKGVK